MEKKQLNFSAPLMSARRYSSPLRHSGEEERRDPPPKDPNPIPTRKSDVNLGEVVKPGSIPFIWEQIPGKSKGSNESQFEVPNNSKLPPGNILGEMNAFRTPNKLSGELIVPRPRSKLPGELNIPRPQKFSGELSNLRTNKFSGEINTLRSNSKLSGELKALSGKFNSSNDIAVWDSSKEGAEMNESSESEDNNATFPDAMESQRESFSINCSVSGLSQSEPHETKLSSNLPTDPKARDFMMNRFLPAAKAMIIEPSQYTSRKQFRTVEQPVEVKDLVPRAMTPPPNSNMCKIVPYIGQDIGSDESEEEEEEEKEDSYDERSTLSVKVKACRFFPWFSSKNSLRLVNSLTSLKDRSKNVLLSASKLSKLVKTKSWWSPSPKLVKDPCSKAKHVRQVYKSCELQKLPKYTPRPMFYSGELQTRSGSPYRSSKGSNVSPFRNELPQSLYQKGVGFLAVPKWVDSFDENQSKVPQKGSKRFEEPGRKTRGSSTRIPVVEKTQYVDSVNITKVSHSILNLPKTKNRVNLSVEEAVRLEYGGRLELMKARGMSGPLVYGGVHSYEPSRISDRNMNTPPMPKSPSESWLSRQLPSVSPRVSPRTSVSYSSMNSKLLERAQSAKALTSGAKWENVVKSSHLCQEHELYAEELITHVFTAA